MARPRGSVRTVAVLLATGLAAGLGIATATPAAADEVFAVGSGGLALTGHGWGHGIGMSAWGEQGAALQGRTYTQILDFYYPGTTKGSRGGTMAVRIDDAGTSQTAVAATAGLQAADLGDGATWTLPSGPSQWRVKLQSNGAGWLESLTGSTWTKWLPPDGRAYLKGILRFQNGPISIVLNSGSLRKVRGVVDAIGTGNGALMTVNTLGLEDYVRGVMGAEVPPSWKPEALKSQAVAVRSFGVWKRDQASGGYQVCSTDACQVYRGMDSEYAATSAAVDATAGEVREYRGATALTMFSASNGGYSVASNLPYLIAQPDPYDEAAGQDPNHTWTTTVSAASLNAAFSVGTVTRVRVLARDGNGEWGGRVTSVAVDGTGGSTTVSGNTFQARLGLKSTWWTGPAQSAILARWNQMGGNGSVLGPIASAEYAVPNGAAQDFARGTMYWSQWTGAHWAWGAIKAYYLGAGGSGGAFRFPVSDEYSVPGGAAEDFETARVYWSSDFGTAHVWGGIKVAYDRWGAAAALGVPTGAEHAVSGGSEQVFARGRVLWSSATDAHPLWGAIEQGWTNRGGLGAMGFAATDELRDGPVAYQNFQVGQVVWSASTGAHATWGAIRATWTGRSGWRGPLGLPVTDETGVAGGTAQGFQGGVVAWKQDAGASVVWGAIGARYVKEGSAAGALGLPLGNEQATATGATQAFEHGHITWDAATNTTQVTP
ncbi:MAG TPA: SpoIID/LytB domain-containing protein [Lapillicoccus sp.]|nr:SpoIID/LytB domain-containing protein [Lapillicoccus sp.]